LAKHQAQMAMDKASKACGIMKQISILEDKVSGLMVKIMHLKECDSFLLGIVESTCEMLRCEIPCGFSCFLLGFSIFVPSGPYLCSVFPSRLTFPQFSPRSNLKPLAEARTGGLRSGQRP
jgi:hypothetical protein